MRRLCVKVRTTLLCRGACRPRRCMLQRSCWLPCHPLSSSRVVILASGDGRCSSSGSSDTLLMYIIGLLLISHACILAAADGDAALLQRTVTLTETGNRNRRKTTELQTRPIIEIIVRRCVRNNRGYDTYRLHLGGRALLTEDDAACLGHLDAWKSRKFLVTREVGF